MRIVTAVYQAIINKQLGFPWALERVETAFTATCFIWAFHTWSFRNVCVF